MRFQELTYVNLRLQIPSPQIAQTEIAQPRLVEIVFVVARPVDRKTEEPVVNLDPGGEETPL